MTLRNTLSSRWWHAAGYAAARKGDFDGALRHFDRALRYRESRLTRACRAMVLTLLGRRVDARAEYSRVACTEPATDPDSEYARLYAQMFLAYVEDRLTEADLLAERLRQTDCRSTVTKLLIPMNRPSLLAADSVLASMGIKTADPMGFRVSGSGVHWMKAVEAYSKRNFREAMAHVGEAEMARALSPAQRALKAGLLVHLDRADEADMLFDELVDELEGSEVPDDIYVRLFCEHHRSTTEHADASQFFDASDALARQTCLGHFLPIERIDSDQIKHHFESLRTTYQVNSVKVAIVEGK